MDAVGLYGGGGRRRFLDLEGSKKGEDLMGTLKHVFLSMSLFSFFDI